MQLPSLEKIGGDLNASGARDIHFPKLRHVGGNFRVDGTGLAHLPENLEHIGGDAFVSSSDPSTLLAELMEAKRKGILKGALFVDGKLYEAAPAKPS
jgi:hypothetical protein